MQQIDYLIVGQGLAGSLLAWSLLAKVASVHLIDNSQQHASSTVAAGLVNPVTGKRLLKADDTDRCFQAAIKLYAELANEFNQDFYHPVAMLRLFKNQAQADLLPKRLDDPDYQDYLGKSIQPGDDLYPLQNAMGGVLQKRTGYLDIPLLLATLEDFFQQNEMLHQARLDHAELTQSASAISWRDIHARCCIFCEGYQAINNPWFRQLPFQPAKGEILTLKSDQIPGKHIINKGNWLIPTSTGDFKTGSTSVWQFKDDSPTLEGRQAIENNLQQLFIDQPDYEVINQQAGIRPATRDKKPFIGLHPDYQTLGIFNGFGARGSLTIPYYAERFASFLSTGLPLPAAVDIQRLAV